jgi:CelD/BcsL family acetyltransferase involved in cellulose biosynthesis
LLLLAESVQRATEEGCTVYDMLLGDEGFKSRFADRRREVTTVTIAPAVSTARLRASARNAARRGWRRLRSSRLGERLGLGD